MATAAAIMYLQSDQFYLFLIYKSARDFLPSFGSKEIVQNKFSRLRPGQPSCISIETILAIFDLQVTLILPTKFQINWPLGSREEVQSRFSRCRLWQPSYISNQNYLSFFWSTNDFLHHGGHLGFMIRTILFIFDLKAAPILHTKFCLNWPFSSGEEAQK